MSTQRVRAINLGIMTAKVGWLSCIEFLLLIATPETVERLRTYSRAAFIDIR
jgi:hypothetical protein